MILDPFFSSFSHTCDVDSFLIRTRVTGAGHHHRDCRVVLVPHGGTVGQPASQGVQDHLVQVALEQRQQHLQWRRRAPSVQTTMAANADA